MLFKLTTSLLLVCVTCSVLVVCEDVTVAPGSTNVHLQCTASSVTNPTWEKDNATINENSKGYTIVPENSTLIIAKIDSQHMGPYICKDKNQTVLQTINVWVPPFVKQFDKSKNMIEDDPLQLECKGYGYPLPVVQWFFKGQLLTPDERITLKDTPAQTESSVMTNGTIRIVKMTFDDKGDYECVATNYYGMNNATIQVNVKDKLAALWPFLGICAEVAILCTIIFCYERNRTKKMREEEERAAEEAERLNSNNDTKPVDDVRQRK